MSEDRRQRLTDLGAEALANALLELASYSDIADDLVERMTATPKENVQRFEVKLAAIKHPEHFVRWGESGSFAHELKGLLQDLKAGVVDDPKIGSELVATFYETDLAVFENCDDSSDYVGDVYRFDAKDLFVSYALRCADKDWLVNLVLKLNRKDDYGVRAPLIECATEYLPEPNVRIVILRLQELADKESDNYKKRHWLHLVESLARQIKDALLFEKTRIASWGPPSPAACIDIAQVYQESGDARTALSWLQQVPADETFRTYERDQLLLEILGQLGETEKQASVAWRIFRRYRNKDSFQKLLSIIGDEHREAITAGEVGSILGAKKLSLSDVAFLVELGRMDEAENYLFQCAGELNGDFYGSLLPLAEAMETAERHLVATIVYRALLDSILRRAKAKTYSHGVRYLKKLDRLAKSISDWRRLGDHNSYLQQLRQAHGRKSSFWSQYGN
ncbi:MAG: DUF6880 family protein [Acidiferrobacter sp.]